MRHSHHQDQIRGQQAVVLGAGRSGIAAARFLVQLGARVRLLERDLGAASAVPTDLGFEIISGEHQPADLASASLVVLSPGIARARVVHLLPAQAVVVSELELGAWFVSKPMIAITGTNGKTTVTTLVGRILEQNGRRVFLGGNIGTPLCDYLLDAEQADVLVLEVSSFQLQNSPTFHPQVGVLLNFSANHLDYHASMDEYLEAKLSMFAHMMPADLAIAPKSMRTELEERAFTPARRVYFQASTRFACPGLPGAHNLENLEAAALACSFFGLKDEDIQRGMDGFSSLPHRLQVVGQKGDILFIDDSKSTTIDSMMAALKSQDRPVRLLAGGVFKGGDLEQVAPLLRERVRGVYLFGDSREIFESAWRGSGVPMCWSASLEEAVFRAAGESAAGECVLLSPATASFDLFANYKERGLAFQTAASTWMRGARP